MKVNICGYEIDVPPTVNPFGDDYQYREVVRETEKAYLVKVHINHRTFGNKTVFKWVAKSACKVDANGDVFVPVWLV